MAPAGSRVHECSNPGLLHITSVQPADALSRLDGLRVGYLALQTIMYISPVPEREMLPGPSAR
jgi:hypothetical protein